MDIRDLNYDITNWQTTPGHIGQTALDAIGLISGIGIVKYADEIGTLLEAAEMVLDSITARTVPMVLRPHGSMVLNRKNRPHGSPWFIRTVPMVLQNRPHGSPHGSPMVLPWFLVLWFSPILLTAIM